MSTKFALREFAACGAESGPGAGQFWPIVAAAIFAARRQAGSAAAIGYDRAVKKHIAIVEDEPALRENYSASLARHGYLVKTYANRKAAMQAFAMRLPDLAIVDISLEDEAEGGFDLCRELRALSAELPIIFLTARDSELDAVSGLRLGADDFLTKDVSLAAPRGAGGRAVPPHRRVAASGSKPPTWCGAAPSPSMRTRCRPPGTARRSACP